MTILMWQQITMQRVLCRNSIHNILTDQLENKRINVTYDLTDAHNAGQYIT